MSVPSRPKWVVLFTAACIAVTPLAALNDSRRQDDSRRVKIAIEQSLKTDPQNSALWNQLGFANHKLGDTDAAQAAFEKAASLDPSDGDAFYMLGLIYEKKKMTAEAVQAWKNVLNVSKDKRKRDVAEKHLRNLNKK